MLPFNFSDDAPSCRASEVFCIRIDPKIVRSEELLKSIYYLLWLPGYFGFNWDALYDCLRDLEWIPFNKVLVLHEVVPSLPEQDLKIYLEVLRDAIIELKMKEGRKLEVFFRESDRCAVEAALAK